MRTAPPDQPSPRPSLNRVLYGSFRSLAVGGFVGLSLVVVAVAGWAGRQLTVATDATMVDEARRNLAEVTRREAEVRNEPFERINAHAKLLQRDEEAILAAPQLHPPPRGAIRLAEGPKGSHYKADDNGGASVYISGRHPLTDEVRTLAQVTEAFDPLMQSVLVDMPDIIAAVYFNSRETLNRYLPRIDKVIEVFDPQLDVREFNFYYVADDAHNPRGGPKWTEAYLDPAGQGWMVTCAVPIRQGGQLRGVTGIDVTIGKLLKGVIGMAMPYNGSALLTSADGQILAMAPALEPTLGLRELVGHDYAGKPVAVEVLKPEAFRVDKSPKAEVRAFFATALRAAPGQTATVRLGGRDWLVSQGMLAVPGWRLFVFTPLDEVRVPIEQLRQRWLYLMVAAIALMVAVGILVTWLVVRRSSRLAAEIAAPLRQLSAETSQLGTTERVGTMAATGIDEIDTLTGNFQRMARELAERQRIATEAEVARNVQARSQELLLRVLPEPIVARMMAGELVIADSHDAVTVLFADIVGFTPLSARMTAKDALHLLEELFVAFDDICRRHGVEKIKTIGDAYMAVAGAPFACPDHAERMARVALEMQHILTQRDGSENLQMRIGIHSGAVAAGVLGKDRFVYDLWGDTVNVASRLESHGAAGRIQISQETRDLLGDRFETEARGRIELKGRGLTATWWLIAERQDSDAHADGRAQQV